MKKWVRILGIVILAEIIVIAVLLSRSNPEDVWNYSYLEDGSVKITGYEGKKTSVEIPETLGREPVTVIGESAFDDTGLRSVKIPEGVTTIGDHAFYDCEN